MFKTFLRVNQKRLWSEAKSVVSLVAGQEQIDRSNFFEDIGVL